MTNTQIDAETSAAPGPGPVWLPGIGRLRNALLLAAFAVVVVVLAIARLGGSAGAAEQVAVTFVDAADTEGIVVEGRPFDDVRADIEERIVLVATDPDVNAVKLVLPGLSGLGQRALADASIAFPTDCIGATSACFEVAGTLPLGDVLGVDVPIVLSGSWSDTDGPSIGVQLGGSDTDVNIGQAVALVGTLFPALDVSDVGSLGTALQLDGVSVAFEWNPSGETFLDLTAGTAIGSDVVLRALLSATIPAGASASDAVLVVGFRVDDAAGSDTITLGGLLGDGLGSSLAGSLELPTFALGTAFPTGADVRPTCPTDATGCLELRPFVTDFFSGADGEGAFTDPAAGDQISFAGTLQLGAIVDVDSLGSDVRNVFGFAEDARLVLLGELGFSVADLVAGDVSLDSLALTMNLPGLEGAATVAMPDWLSFDDAVAKISWSSEDGLELSVDSGITVEIPDNTQPGGAFASSFDISAALSRSPGGDLSVSFSGVSTNEWVAPYGIGWMTLTGLGAELQVDVPSGGSPAVSAAVTASFELDIDGSPTAFSVGIAGSTSPLSLSITASLDGQLTLLQTLAAVGVDTSDFPSAFDVSVGPASITVSVTGGSGSPSVDVSLGGTASVTFTESLTLTGEIYFGFEFGGSGTPAVTFGLRTSGLSLTELLGLSQDPFGLGELPTLGFVGRIGGSGGLELDSSTLTPEARRFFSAFGCASDPDCDFQLDLAPGAHFLAALAVPDGLEDVAEMLYVDTDRPSLLQVSIPLPSGGGFDLSSFELRLSLPDVVPPEEIDFISRGSLAVAFLPAQGTLQLEGSLDLRFRAGDVAPAATTTMPVDCGRSWLQVSRSDTSAPPLHACYQELTLEVAAGIALGTSVEIFIEGAVTTPAYGWPEPFGLEFLTFQEFRLRLDIKLEATGPSFGIGVLAAGKIFDTDFSGSLSVGLRIVSPAPTPIGVSIVPDFRGMRFASQAGIGTGDLMSLYGVLRDLAAADPDNTLGFALPEPAAITGDGGLPDFSLRNIEVMIGLADIPSLCIEPGLKLAGELYIGAGPAAAATAELPPVCTTGLPAADPSTCAARPGCFASALLNVTGDGIVISGAVGEFDIGVVNCEDMLFDLRLTVDLQRLLMEAGCEVPGIGSGSVKVRIGIDGIAFSGDLVLFPGSPGVSFDAMIEGEARFSSGPFPDISDPASLLALDFNLHIVLQSDFVGYVSQQIEPVLQGIRTTGLAIDSVLTNIESSGDPLQALIDLPADMAAIGAPLPSWYSEFAASLQTFKTSLSHAGVSIPSINDVLGGFDVTVPGLPGYWSPSQRECRKVSTIGGFTTVFKGTVVNGVCYTNPPGSFLGGSSGTAGAWVERTCYAAPFLRGTVINGTCYSIPPTTIPIPGLHQISGGVIPSSVAGVMASLESAINPVLQAIPGIPPGTTVSQFRTELVGVLKSAQSPFFALPCVDIRFESFGTGGGPVLTLRLDMVVLGQQRGLTLAWNFGENPVTQAPALVQQVSTQLFVSPQPTACEPFGITTVAGTGGGIDGGVVDDDGSGNALPPSDFDIAVTPNSVNEGTDQATVTATLNRDVLPDSPVTLGVTWGDGSSSTIVVSSGKVGTASHTYADDRPSGSDAGIETITVTGLSRTRTSNVVVRNVAPSNVSVAPFATKEGDEYTLTGSFTDPGLLDVHTVTVRWGDGTTSTDTLPVGARTFSLTHTYVDDEPPGTSRDDFTVAVTVADDDLGVGTAVTTATVVNVPPTLTGFQRLVDGVPSDDPILEGEFVEYLVTWSDPAPERRYEVTIGWGDVDWGPEFEEETYVVIDPLGGPAPTEVVVSHRFGDTGSFPVIVTLVDEDHDEHETITPETVHVTVLNVDPTVTLHTGAATGFVVPPSGEPTRIVREGETVSFLADLEDPGSDDLTTTWDWADGNISSALHLNDPAVGPDPAPSPTDNPRFVIDQQSHAWSDACLYIVDVTVDDDDGGASAEQMAVVVTGTDHRVRGAGWWWNEYREGRRNPNSLSQERLDCYLDIVRHMSSVFMTAAEVAELAGDGGHRRATETNDEARDVLNTAGTSAAHEILQRQLLAGWLNLAQGSLRWDQMVDTTGNRQPDTEFGVLLAQAETLLLDPSATRSQLLTVKDRIDRVVG